MSINLNKVMILSALAIGHVAISRSQAAVVVTLPTVSAPGSVVFTQDIDLTITNAGTFQALYFDDWVTSDGTLSRIITFGTPNLTYQLNGGASAILALSNFTDNLSFSFSGVTSGDGFLVFASPLAVAINDVFTVKAQTLTIPAGVLPSDFNPQANQVFTGNAFLADESSFERLSVLTSVGAIPEPSTIALGCIASLTLLRRRRNSLVCS